MLATFCWRGWEELGKKLRTHFFSKTLNCILWKYYKTLKLPTLNYQSWYISFFSTKRSLEMLKFLAPRGMCCLHPQSSSRGGKHFFWQKWFSDKKKDKTYKRQNLMKERIISLYSIFEGRKHLLTSGWKVNNKFVFNIWGKATFIDFKKGE